MRTYFSAAEIENDLSGHEATSVIFSANGMRIWMGCTVGEPGVFYLVEHLGSDDRIEKFDTIAEAARYADEHQKLSA